MCRLEIVVEPWIDSLWSPLSQALSDSEPDSKTSQSGADTKLGTDAEPCTGTVSGTGTERTIDSNTSGVEPGMDVSVESNMGMESGSRNQLLSDGTDGSLQAKIVSSVMDRGRNSEASNDCLSTKHLLKGTEDVAGKEMAGGSGESLEEVPLPENDYSTKTGTGKVSPAVRPGSDAELAQVIGSGKVSLESESTTSPGAGERAVCDVSGLSGSLGRLALVDSEASRSREVAAPLQRNVSTVCEDHTDHDAPLIQALKSSLTGSSSSGLAVPSASPAFLQVQMMSVSN